MLLHFKHKVASSADCHQCARKSIADSKKATACRMWLDIVVVGKFVHKILYSRSKIQLKREWENEEIYVTESERNKPILAQSPTEMIWIQGHFGHFGRRRHHNGTTCNRGDAISSATTLIAAIGISLFTLGEADLISMWCGGRLMMRSSTTTKVFRVA